MRCLLLFVILFSCSWSSVESHELKFVQGIFRHGHRAPMRFPYPLDPYTEEFWPRGWAQLTMLGMRQVRELGQYFKQRYANFLSPDFNKQELFVQSSDVERALVSAQSFLYGLYPTTSNYSVFGNIDWQPIPVHASSPGEDDLLCHSTSISCPNAEAITQPIMANLTDFYNNKYADLFTLLGEVTGYSNFSYDYVKYVAQSICEDQFGYFDLQPDWKYLVWPQYDNKTSMEVIDQMTNENFVMVYGNPEISKYYAGYAVNYWVETALAVAAGTQTRLSKMKIFSSHDDSQMSLTTTMGMESFGMPSYASIFIMEVYKETNGEHTVEFYFRNDTTVEPYPFHPPGCGQPCLVSQLPVIYADVMTKTKEDVKKVGDKNN